MASYHIRQRDPLIDSNMQAIIERRGKELLGLCLIGIGATLAMILGSYVPDDASWMAATDEPAANALGRFGALIAAPLIIITGKGAWGLVVAFCFWGMRLVLHRGSERALSRAIFVPIAVAFTSVYAASLVPGAGWSHSFGLGGLFGDTVLGALLSAAPVETRTGVNLMSVLLALATLAIWAFVLGVVKSELRALGRLMLVGTVLCYAGIMALLRRAVLGLAKPIRRARDHDRSRREAAAALGVPQGQGGAEPRLRTPPRVAPRIGAASRVDDAHALQAKRGQGVAETPAVAPSGLLARVPGLMRRVRSGDEIRYPEPELPERDLASLADTIESPNEDRIRARIADAVRARAQQAREPRATVSLPADRMSEPPLTRMSEPPLTRAAASPVVAPTRAERTQEIPAESHAAALHRSHDDHDDAFLTDEDPLFDVDAPSVAASPASEPRRVVQHTGRRMPAPSRQAQAEMQPALRFDEPRTAYELPPLSLLSNPKVVQRHQLSDEALEENARMLENVLDDYGVRGEIVSVRPGPVVTMYELEPAPGLKASRVIGLADDIARSMSALSARVSTVPGRSVIGIELPNTYREKVVLREILSARDFGDAQMRLALALGKGIDGEPIVANLAKMPHLLIAGTTGSGKSVAINTMILSLLYKLTPEECRLIMIDPKMLELSVYDGIPHLLSPVVTDPKKAVVALKWVVAEMEERYRKMSKMGVRNIEGYNGRVREALDKGEMFKRTVQTGFDDETGDPVFETEEFAPEAIPYIVVIVDEMADLMMVAGKEIEACIQRLAQMARASGIHLIMATQRPSVDVITGTIKANFPTRISFQVTSKIDSRTILGEQGAEQLLGMGDMLYMAGGARITRIHGPFVSDEEVEEIVNHLKSFGPPEYKSGVVEGPDEDKEADIDLVLGLGGNTDGEDALYDQAVAVVARDRKCSTSYIQRKLGIGYNKAARLVEQMEDQGVVTSANHVGKREILLPEQ